MQKFASYLSSVHLPVSRWSRSQSVSPRKEIPWCEGIIKSAQVELWGLSREEKKKRDRNSPKQKQRNEGLQTWYISRDKQSRDTYISNEKVTEFHPDRIMLLQQHLLVFSPASISCLQLTQPPRKKTSDFSKPNTNMTEQCCQGRRTRDRHV